MANLINTELIINFMKENSLTKTQFAKLCRIGVGTLNRVLSNCENIDVIVLFKIAKAMKVQCYQLFN